MSADFSAAGVSFEENFYVEFVLRVFLNSYVINFETTCCSPYSLLRSSPHFLRRCSPISLKCSPFPKKRRAETQFRDDLLFSLFPIAKFSPFTKKMFSHFPEMLPISQEETCRNPISLVLVAVFSIIIKSTDFFNY